MWNLKKKCQKILQKYSPKNWSKELVEKIGQKNWSKKLVKRIGQKIHQKINKKKLVKSSSKKIHIRYHISAMFPRKLFGEFGLMYCDLLSQFIKVWKLFKGRNYSRKYSIQKKCINFWTITVFT